MDFFERQAQARQSTRKLVVYFATGVLLLILAVYLAVLLFFQAFVLNDEHRHRYDAAQQLTAVDLWNPKLFAGVTLATLGVILIGGMQKASELSEGGSAVASMLGGRLVNPHTTDPDERRLLNVVEEMAIASGLPVPQVFVLPNERGINAFAAGHSTSDTVVAITEGSLRLLNRDELQGVIGHEFSHILNGDMRLNLRLIAVIFGIMCLSIIGQVLLNTRGRKNPLPLLGLLLMAIGWIGVFFGRLIQAAVSRQREYLADASSVQFTRNPAGLSGALKKIGGLSYGSRLESAHAQEASHLFFGNGMGSSFLHLLDTHPPLPDRIKAIEPSFDGRFPHVVLPQEPSSATPAEPQRRTSPFPLPGGAGGGMFFPPILAGGTSSTAADSISEIAPPVIVARTALSNLGHATPAHLRYAKELRCSIPENLRLTARSPFGASALIYALLLSDDQSKQTKQLSELDTSTSPGISQETLRVLGEIQSLPTHAKLPLVDLALPALRELSPDQFKQFHDAIRVLVESDGEIDLFEYVLQKIVLRHLEPQFTQARKPVIQYYSLKPLIPGCAVLLSQLAYLGQSDPAQVQAAFQAGAQPLSYATGVPMTLLPPDRCDLSQVDEVLNHLDVAGPQIKKNVLNACAQTVAADGVLQEMEAELLRAIADTLDCPMPPFLGGPAQETAS
jgi:Zn-dependent protease with chaperone function